MMMRVMIAEDEPAARRKLARLLTAEPDIAVVAAAENGTQAAALAESLRPEVSFLDIQMPGITGLDVAAQISSFSLVVFITAFSEHAPRAFEINAVDYLLKPYTRERLQATLQRVRQRLKTEFQTAPNIELHTQVRTERQQRISSALALIKRANNEPSALPFLSAREHGKPKPITLDSISWVEAEDNYCRLHFGNENSLQRITLTAFLERVGDAVMDAAGNANAAKFVRIHRSSAVNIQHLAEITPLMSGDAFLVLRSGAKIRLSRRYRQEFFGQLGEARFDSFRLPQT